MNVTYQSTRGGSRGVSASKAILQGLADDGGLFMPETMPKLGLSMKDLSGMDYRGVAMEVMKLFLTDFSEEELKYCIDHAYDSKFDDARIAPIRKADGKYFLELFHGSTIAFKDMALSILPYLMTTAAKKNNVSDEIVILTATSGDTGKAALAGFADVPGTRIIVFYPKGGVSRIQELQMVTQKGDNTAVAAIRGNFDDAQTGVKNIFADREFAARAAEHGIRFSSANSINIGRLVPQIVYYVYACASLLADGSLKDGEKLNVTVPTGNFGNILAAYMAKLIGAPIGKLVCASNDNRVLYDFFATGLYDRRRDFILTTSPSMDILISSNLERLIYLSTGRDAAKTAALMKDLKEKGYYRADDSMREFMADFCGEYADQEENAAGIGRLYEKTGYVVDTHTGVGLCAAGKYMAKTGDAAPMLIASTASPFKFAQSVMGAIEGRDLSAEDVFCVIERLGVFSGVCVPKAVADIESAPILHTAVCDVADMEKYIAGVLGME